MPDGLDDETFTALFAEHGNVLSTKLLADKWYGFVNFSTPEEATHIIETLNGAEYEGRTLQVRPHGKGGGSAGGKGDGGKAGKAAKASKAVSDGGYDVASFLAVNGFGKAAGKAASAVASERSVPYKAWSSAPPQTVQPPAWGAWKGGGKAAQEVVELAAPELQGACAASQDGFIPGRSPDYSKGEDASNLYIKGLPADADELYLYKIFAPFGCVLTTFVKETALGVIGFVTFMRDGEAEYAIQRMNGAYTTQGTQLNVSLQIKKKGAGKGKGW